MKKILTIISALTILTGSLQAQDTLRKRDPLKTQTQKQSRMYTEDHFMFQNGKLYQMKQGVRTEIQNQVKLSDGTLINPDGTYEKEGRQLRLGEGECIDMNGNHYKSRMMFNKRRPMDQQTMQKNRRKASGTGRKPMPGN